MAPALLCLPVRLCHCCRVSVLGHIWWEPFGAAQTPHTQPAAHPSLLPAVHPLVLLLLSPILFFLPF